MGAAHHAIASSLYPNLDYNIEKDFIAVALIARPPQVVVVNPDKVAAKTLAEFIAYAKANPGKLNYGSAGARHHASSRGRTVQDPDQDRHPARPLSRGRPAMQDLIAGHVPVVSRRARFVGRARQGRTVARARRRRAETRAGIPRSSDRRGSWPGWI